MRPITPLDDKQLWRIIDHKEGCDYSWPLYATPAKDSSGDCYFIELAHPAESEAQWQFVSKILGDRAFDSDGPRWLMRRGPFEQLALKCNGVTPKYYLKWGEPLSENKPRISDPPKLPDISKEDGFLKFACAEAGLTNLPQVKLAFKLLNAFALRWMLEKQKPLDLGFCKIHALPYRANWQSILHAKNPNILPVFRKKKRALNDILEAMGFFEQLHDAELIEMHEQTFGWSLAITESKTFTNTADAIERGTYDGATPKRYLMRWSSLVQKHYANILEVFGHWLEKTAHPVGHVELPREKALWRLVPKKSRGRVYPNTPKPPETRLSSDTFNPEDEPARSAETAQEPDAGLP
jgi:hypothetical protein